MSWRSKKRKYVWFCFDCHNWWDKTHLNSSSSWGRQRKGRVPFRGTKSSFSGCCPSITKSWLTLWPRELQHARLPCHSLSPEVYSNSCPSSRWCHPIIPSSITSFSSCPQSFPTSRYFPVSQFFPTGGQILGASASASILPVNFQGWFPLALTGLISLQSKWLSRVFSSTVVQKHQYFGPAFTSIHDYWKNHSFD